jgi:DNA-binding NarL/FixJ family response regulator
MENTQSTPHFVVYICSRNALAVWAIESLLTPNWSLARWFPKQLLIAPQGVHILLVDVCSVLEWPEAVRKWTDAGHRTILLVAEGWDTEGTELRALHLGVRAIVHIERDSIRRLSKVIDCVAHGQLFASNDALNDFYCGSRRPRPHSKSANLSFREEQVLDLLLKGMSNRRIGVVLGISERTAKFHVCNILRKLQIRTRIELIEKYDSLFAIGKPA